MLPRVLPKEDFSDPLFSSHKGELASQSDVCISHKLVSMSALAKVFLASSGHGSSESTTIYSVVTKKKRVVLPPSLEVQLRSLVSIAAHSLGLPADCLVHGTWHLAFSLLWVLCDAPRS